MTGIRYQESVAISSEPFSTSEMKAPGCPWDFAGHVGISEKLFVFDEYWAVGHAGDLSTRGRRALAKHMIELWTRFGDGELPPTVPG